MKKRFQIPSLAFVLACLFAAPAYADALVPEEFTNTTTPAHTLLYVLIAAVVLVAAGFCVRAVVKKRKSGRDDKK